MLEILKGETVVATIRPGQSFRDEAEKRTIFNVQIDTVIPGHTVREYVAPEPEPEPITSDDVDAERDRRISDGFSFGGVRYQARAEDRENIAGAATAALAAIIAGAQEGDFRWHGGESDFVWIAEDNSLVAMDAHTVLAFGQAAMSHKQAHIFAARALKDMDPIPEDYIDDAYWP